MVTEVNNFSLSNSWTQVTKKATEEQRRETETTLKMTEKQCEKREIT